MRFAAFVQRLAGALGRLALGLSLGLSLWGLSAISALAGEIGRGADSFRFESWAGPPLTVWTYKPEAAGPDAPIVFIMHGAKRNGAEYRDQWAGMADAYGFIVIAPEFPRSDFPTANEYNLGGRRDGEGELRPAALWSYSAIEPLFDAVRADLGSAAQGYRIYGHSAGAQFVHRFVLHTPEARVERAVAGNAGWYQLPMGAELFPYGVGGEPVDEAALAAYFTKPITVLLGTADTVADPNLRVTPEALRQGAHRLERGRTFYAVSRAEAARLDAPFAWRLAFAPGIDHDNAKMAQHAAPLLLD